MALKNSLKEQIETGKLRVGMQLPGENELASQYNISRPSVRKALDELEAASLIYRIAGKGSFVNDQTQDTPARILTLGIDFMDQVIGNDWYYGKILAGAKQACMKHNCRLATISQEELDCIPDNYIDGLISMNVRGEHVDQINALYRRGIPTVMINSFPTSKNIGYVSVDYREEARRGVEYLLDIGHRNIAIINSNTRPGDAATERTKGYEDAFKQAGVPLNKELYFSMDPVKKIVDILADFLSNKEITAVFITNGAWFELFLLSAARLNLKIPDDMSVLCFDNVDVFTDACGVSVSAIHMPLEYMGRRSVESLVERILKGAECPVIRETVEASLVINRSCKKNVSKY